MASFSRHHENLFTNSCMLFEGFPEKCDALRMMRSNLMERVSSVRWATAWDNHAKPLIYEVIAQKSS
ncbi:hypothetical protein CASFOL_017170 [Castilleja foliolosa]|uniref:Uncharacterized protein n=1 Tax=Castilleja foliolosa TaxID=1961234 RepID=A0ABD3DAR9_9LAMI